MDEMSMRATLLLITVIAMSKIAPSQSWSMTMQMDTVKPQTFDVSVERTFDDLLTVTLSGGYDHLEPQTIKLNLGRYEFSNIIREDDTDGFDYWEMQSPITRCFTLSRNHEGCVIPTSMGSCSSNCCKAVCLKLENRDKLQTDPLNLSIEIEILCCRTESSGPNCGPLNNSSGGGKVFHCPIRYSQSLHNAKMNVERGYKAILDHAGKLTQKRSFMNLNAARIESAGLILDSSDKSVKEDPLWNSHLYHYYIEHTIDDRLIGLIGFGNKTIDYAGYFNVARKEFNPADISLKCSSVQSISKKYHFVCPMLHPISDGTCTSVNFKLSYMVVSCDEAYRDNGWLCYKKGLLAANHSLNLEVPLGYRISTDGRSIESTRNPIDRRYKLYNKMLIPEEYIVMMDCPVYWYDQQLYAVIFRRTSDHFVIQFWRGHECINDVFTRTVVLLLHSENKTQIMFQEQSRRICLDAIISDDKNIVCEKCNRVCLFFYDMESGPSPNDPIRFKFMIELIAGEKKKECRPQEPEYQMFIGDEVFARKRRTQLVADDL